MSELLRTLLLCNSKKKEMPDWQWREKMEAYSKEQILVGYRNAQILVEIHNLKICVGDLIKKYDVFRFI